MINKMIPSTKYLRKKRYEDEDLSTLGRLKATIIDLTNPHIFEFHEYFSCLMLGLLSNLDTRKFMWPSTKIWNTLKPSSLHLHTLAK